MECAHAAPVVSSYGSIEDARDFAFWLLKRERRDTNHFIVMRGIPGCGKSSVTREIEWKCRNEGVSCCVASADKFFEALGEYVPGRIGEAHSECLAEVLDNLFFRTQVIVVDNTHTLVSCGRVVLSG